MVHAKMGTPLHPIAPHTSAVMITANRQARQISQSRMAERLEILVPAVAQETQIPIDPLDRDVTEVPPEQLHGLFEDQAALSERLIRRMHPRAGQNFRHCNEITIARQPDPQVVVKRTPQVFVQHTYGLKCVATQECGRLANAALALKHGGSKRRNGRITPDAIPVPVDPEPLTVYD